MSIITTYFFNKRKYLIVYINRKTSNSYETRHFKIKKSEEKTQTYILSILLVFNLTLSSLKRPRNC